MLLTARNLCKSYCKNQIQLPVLRGIDLDIEPGELTALVGRSGSGKSTLMHLLATLDQPDAGTLHFDGERIDNASRRVRDRFRNQSIGVIFQFYHLLPELTAIENILSTAMIRLGPIEYLRARRSLHARAEAMLDRVGLSHRRTHRPAELSGGEMQRVAIGRALMNQPTLLLADEPTGNLDSETGETILDLLQTLHREDGLTILMITHDDDVAARAQRCLRMADGRLVNAHETSADAAGGWTSAHAAAPDSNLAAA